MASRPRSCRPNAFAEAANRQGFRLGGLLHATGACRELVRNMQNVVTRSSARLPTRCTSGRAPTSRRDSTRRGRPHGPDGCRRIAPCSAARAPDGRRHRGRMVQEVNSNVPPGTAAHVGDREPLRSREPTRSRAVAPRPGRQRLSSTAACRPPCPLVENSSEKFRMSRSVAGRSTSEPRAGWRSGCRRNPARVRQVGGRSCGAGVSAS